MVIYILVANNSSSSASSSTDSIEPELLLKFNPELQLANNQNKANFSSAEESKDLESVDLPSSETCRFVPQESQCRLLLDQVLNEKKLVSLLSLCNSL